MVSGGVFSAPRVAGAPSGHPLFEVVAHPAPVRAQAGRVQTRTRDRQTAIPLLSEMVQAQPEGGVMLSRCPESDALRTEIAALRSALEGCHCLLAAIIRQAGGQVTVDYSALFLDDWSNIERLEMPETKSIIYRLRLDHCRFRHPDGVCIGTDTMCTRSPSMGCFK